MEFSELNDDGFFHPVVEDELSARDQAYEALAPEDDPECEEHWTDLTA